MMGQAMKHAKWPVVGLSALAGLSVVVHLHMLGEPLWAVGMLICLSVALYVYTSATTVAARYLFPGLAALAVFVLFPLVLTLRLSTTNFSAANLLSLDRAGAYLTDQRTRDEGNTFEYTLTTQGDQLHIELRRESASDMPEPVTWVTDAFDRSGAKQTVSARQAEVGTRAALSMAQTIGLRDTLKQLSIKLPDGTTLSYAGLRQFAALTPDWKPEPGGGLTSFKSGESFNPNMQTGFFENASGAKLQPGFTVSVGMANYLKIVASEAIRGPFLSIFAWTCVFAGLTVLLSASLGLTLAVLLNWPALRGRALYRTLLFLPYAVPGFISILVFKGLFNQNFGEINMILSGLFGIKPAWFADPILAKLMLLIVNVWLGYAYFMLLCSGMLQSISSDLYEASALSGAGPWVNFTRITIPQIIGPLTPLLIAAFAFNFNNFVLVALLTDGRPDFLNTTVPAGTTDILVSYTYRIAFKDAGADFGLAAAISTLIFAMVALMALTQLKASRTVKRNNATH